MIGRSRGSPCTPVLTVLRCSAGLASRSSSPAPRTSESTGRRSVRSSTKLHARFSCERCRRAAMTGTRPFSTRSPSFDSVAGSTVIEPTTATATTIIVPMPNDVKTALPASSMPAIAIMTVSPETRTARPDVAAATARASAGGRPASRSSMRRRR